VDELKKFVKMIWHLTLSVLITLLIYFPLAAIESAAANDRVEDGSFFWVPLVISAITEICFLLVVWYVRFHHNDELDKSFMKEYHDKPWRGKKADIPCAIKSELLTYVFVYAIVIIVCGIKMAEPMAANPLGVLYFPLTLMMTAVHPVLGCIISLAVFTVGYTLIACLVREKLATTSRSSTNSTYGTRTYIQRSHHRK